MDSTTFAEAQRLLGNRTHRQSDEKLLEGLRALLAKEGKLSHRLLRDSQLTPSPGAYRRRFGNVSVAYGLIGYGNPSAFGSTDLRHRTQALRADLIRQIQSMFPEEISVVRRGGRWRSQLRVRNVATVSVVVARRVKVWKETIRWQIDPVPREGKLITLLARLNMDNDALLDFHLLPWMDRKKRFLISQRDPWLARAERLPDLAAFREAVLRARAKGNEFPQFQTGKPNYRQ